MIRTVDTKIITENVKEMCIEANHYLSKDMDIAMKNAVTTEKSELGRKILNQLQDNLKIADEEMIPICQDTGYVGNQKCTCFKKAEIELLYTQSNLKEILKKENFDHFSFDYYSDTMKNEATGLTERETARRAYDIARGFVRNFDSSFENLFLYGDTGVGKTFLSHCIAHDLLESAHCVMYFSAFDLFELLADSKFSRDKTEGQEFVFDSDLLIIDDLGTELTNSFVSSQLFLCINERIMRRKSTIISTNLKLENFSDTYSERTFSRIASNYRMVKLEGKDIRIQKIFLGGK